MVEGEPEILVFVKVLFPIGIFIHQSFQSSPYTEWIVGHTKGIDVYLKKVPFHQTTDVFGEAGTHHKDPGLVIQGKRVIWQGNFCEQFHRFRVRFL